MELMKEQQYIRINEYGDKAYYKDKEMKIPHRIDGPAVEYANGYKAWWANGELHRIDGPAVEYANGYKAWWVNGNRHRLDGPAIEYDHGGKQWYVDGNRHRIDGPAVEWSDGTKSFYIDGKYLTEEQFNAFTAPTLELTLEDIAAKFGVDVSKIKIVK